MFYSHGSRHRRCSCIQRIELPGSFLSLFSLRRVSTRTYRRLSGARPAAAGAVAAAALVAGCGGSASSLGVGDFNGDRAPDLAVGLAQDNGVAILMNSGGTLSQSQVVPVGSSPDGVAIGSLRTVEAPPSMFSAVNGTIGTGSASLSKNARDIAVANSGDDTVSALINDGNGGFARHTYPVGDGPTAVALGLFDSGDATDIAVANTTAGTVTVLLGNGNGTFEVGGTYPTGSSPEGLAPADFDGDGALDLVVANAGDDTVQILPGDGDGSFGAGYVRTTADNPVAVVVNDFNGDGRADVAAAASAADRVSILLGTAGGALSTSRTDQRVGGGPASLATGQVNGDGRPDLVTGNTSGSVSVLMGKAGGAFADDPITVSLTGTRVRDIPIPGSPVGVGIDDFNRDGKGDVAVASNRGSNADLDSVSLLLNKDGYTTFLPRQDFGVGIPDPFWG